jgi:hypothetical protein
MKRSQVVQLFNLVECIVVNAHSLREGFSSMHYSMPNSF